MKVRVTNIFLLLLFWSCSSPEKVNYNSIEVDIDERHNVSVLNLFDRIELIPLETSNSSLLSFIDKLICYNDVLYIHDYSEKQILAFGPDGKFLYKINNRGQGPGEYLHISDFDINKEESKMLIVDPVRNELHEYDLTGKFLNKIKLPVIYGAYNKIKWLNTDKIAFWTFDDHNRLKFYNKSDNSIYQEFLPIEEKSLFDQFSVSVFPYCQNMMISSTIDNNIYEISSDGSFTIAYTWNFGKLNNKADIIKRYPKRNLNTLEEIKTLSNQMSSSEIVNYCFTSVGGNRTCRYAQIMRKDKHINIWHNTNKKETIIFEKSTENASFYPSYWDDAFVIGFGPYAGNAFLETTIPDAILSKEDLIKKTLIREDDNPVLIKYYFK